MKLCECGCELPAPIAKKTNRKFGHVAGEPTRFRAGHSAVKPREVVDRLLEKISMGDEGECWEWQGNALPNGYGYLAVGERFTRYGKLLAHRLVYEMQHGPIPDGLCVCHSCDNPHCCNPAHLWLGTNADNLADMAAKGRSAHGSRNGRAKLAQEQVKELRELHRAGGMRHRDLAERFGISRQHVGDLLSGRRWKEPA